MAALSLTYKGNDRAHRVVETVTITDGLHLRRYEVLRSLRHYLWATTRMAYRTITRLEQRGVEKESTRRSSLELQERAIVRTDQHWTGVKGNTGGNV